MLIHRTAGIECFFEDRGGDYLLITFNEMGMRANGQRFWGDKLAKRLGVSVLGFVSAQPNWYPPAEMVESVEIVESVLQDRFPERVIFGHSQGGYAAIKLSRALRSSVSISFCPQYSINPDEIIDVRFNKFFTSGRSGGMKIESGDVSGRVFVFFDPRVPADAMHVRHIAKETAVTEIKMPFSGHSTIKLFAGVEMMGRLIDACRRGDDAQLHQLRALARARNTQRPYLMALRLASRRPSTAAVIFEAHRSQIPWSQWSSICHRLAGTPEAAKAAEWSLEAAAADPENPDNYACAALAFLHLRRPDEARQHIDRALSLKPDNLHYANILRRILNALNPPARHTVPS